MDSAIFGLIDIIPRDVMLIVYKYIWRDNNNRCIEEYTRVYLPHWWTKLDRFDNCEHYEDKNYCPITNNGKMCPYIMYRDIHILRPSNIYKFNSDIRVAKLPKNY